MDLIFLRHGQTDWNLQGLLQGRTDIPLNEEGRRGALKASGILRGMSFDAVYCSPLLRARQTLELVLPEVEPVLDSRIIEWNFGIMEGPPYLEDEFEPRWSLGQPPIEGMELIEDVISRVKDFYEEASTKYSDGRILVVSHGGVSGAMNAVVYGMKKGGNLRKYCLPNSTPVLFREGQEPIILGEKFHEG